MLFQLSTGLVHTVSRAREIEISGAAKGGAAKGGATQHALSVVSTFTVFYTPFSYTYTT